MADLFSSLYPESSCTSGLESSPGSADDAARASTPELQAASSRAPFAVPLVPPVDELQCDLAAEASESNRAQGELWSQASLTDLPPLQVSMPLSDYRVRPVPGLSIPGISLPEILSPIDVDVDGTVSPEHIACKQPTKRAQVARVD